MAAVLLASIGFTGGITGRSMRSILLPAGAFRLSDLPWRHGAEEIRGRGAHRRYGLVRRRRPPAQGPPWQSAAGKRLDRERRPTATRLAGLGVDGIITDKPLAVRDAIS
jgi:hypothetical protein